MLREEELHMQELGIAALSSLMLNINRDPKTPPVKSSDFYHFMRSKAGTFSTIVCDTFAELSKEHLIPEFFFNSTPPDLIQSLIDGKKGTSVAPKLRAIAGDGIFLLCPVIVNGFASAPMGCVDAIADGEYEVRDIDSGQLYDVSVWLDPEVSGTQHAFDECSWSIRKRDRLIIV